MKRSMVLFVTILLTAGTTLTQPKLSIDTNVIDLGIIYSGMKKQGKIILKNIGTDTLQIFSMNPSCGCTAVKQPKKILLPNESDIAEVEFNSTNYHAPVTKYINIVTNDPTSKYISIKLIADVKDELQPVNNVAQLSYAYIKLDSVLSKEVLFKNVTDHTIKIKGFTASSPSTIIKLDKKRLNPNDTLKVEVTFKAEHLGHSFEHFTIETDSKNQPLVEISISYIGSKEN